MKLELKSISKTYHEADGVVIDDLSYSFHPGTFTALMGRSGSGKSTLLNIMAGITKPTSGQVMYGNQDLFSLGERNRSNLRAEVTATIFQDYNLLPFLSAEENINLGRNISKAKSRGLQPTEALRAVRLEDFAKKYPEQMSGGERQRVAIARAVAIGPKIIFADEPTGALDERNSENIVGLLKSIAAGGVTVVMVTHDPYIAAAADTVLELRGGRVASTLDHPTAIQIISELRAHDAEDSGK